MNRFFDHEKLEVYQAMTMTVTITTGEEAGKG
jgi:hypothetical protein